MKVEKLSTANGETQLQVGRKRKADGPKRRRQDGLPPEKWRENTDEEATLSQPIPHANILAINYQPLFPRENNPHAGEKAQVLAEQLAGGVGSSQKLPGSTGALIQIALTDCAADLGELEGGLDTAQDERRGRSSQTTAGLARLSRLSITAEQPGTQMPKPSKPQRQGWASGRP